MAKVLVAGPIHEAGEAMLDARADVETEILYEPSVADLEARIEDIDAIVLRLTPIRADLVARAKRLKVVARYGVGYDAVDVDALTRHGIPLAVVGEANSVAVAEHALGLMLALIREIPAQDRLIREGQFAKRDEFLQTELWRKAVLVAGYGRIGSRVAHRCAAFEMDVIVADPYADAEEVTSKGYRHLTDFREALGDADFVTLHMPANPEGTPLFGQAEIERMKSDAVLINVSRGSLIDEDALFDALSSGRIRCAGLDVLRQEPPPADCPLLTLDNVILTPHSASLTEESARRMSIESVQNALDAIDGCLRPGYVINREVLGAD